MRVTLIHNPTAGHGKPSADTLLKALRKEGYDDVRYASTKEKRWSRVLDKRTDLYAVAGGDGTVGRVARKLAKREIATLPVAVLPLGTANNIAESLNVRGTFKTLIAAWPDMRRVPVDVGEAVGEQTTRWFIESVGSGFFADMMAKEDAEAAEPGGRDEDETPHAALERARKVLRQTLKKARPRKWRVELDGKDQSGDYLLVEAMNMRRIGPGLELAPDATFDDGMIEVAFVCDDEVDRANLDAHLREHPADAPAPPLLRIRRAREVVLDAGRHMLHVDDKSWRRAGPVRLTVGGHKLTFLVP
jgi:diacylglycerol kinase family enzyme